MADQLTPTAARRVTQPSSAGPLAALIAGPDPFRADGPTVLLVPGYTGSKEDFVPILDALADNGFQVIAIDMPGQHESPGPDDETAYTPDRLGDAVASVVTALAGGGGPVVLLGHSYGGLVSRAAVLAGAPVAGLVLLCSGPYRFLAGSRFEALTAGGPILREHGQEVLYDRSQVALGVDPHRPDPLSRFYRARFLASTRAGLQGMGQALLSEPDRVDELATVLARQHIPVAVVAGDADDAWPLDQQRQMAQRLGTDLLLIPAAAHSPAVENPPALLDVLLPLLRRWT